MVWTLQAVQTFNLPQKFRASPHLHLGSYKDDSDAVQEIRPLDMNTTGGSLSGGLQLQREQVLLWASCPYLRCLFQVWLKGGLFLVSHFSLQGFFSMKKILPALSELQNFSWFLPQKELRKLWEEDSAFPTVWMKWIKLLRGKYVIVERLVCSFFCWKFLCEGGSLKRAMQAWERKVFKIALPTYTSMDPCPFWTTRTRLSF